MQAAQLSPSITSQSFRDCRSRWLAVSHRAPDSHFSFVYGVVSTKIYCRPTCAARLARRANVVFYDTSAEARRNGFRPCKRCKPDDDLFLGDKEEIVSKALALLRARPGGLVMKRGLKELAREVGVTPSYLCRAFKKILGVTIGEYMMEFEKDPGDAESQSPSQSSNDPASQQSRERPLVLSSPARSASVPIGEWRDQFAEGYFEKSEVDSPCKFNLDEWFLTEQFLNQSSEICV